MVPPGLEPKRHKAVSRVYCSTTDVDSPCQDSDLGAIFRRDRCFHYITRANTIIVFAYTDEYLLDRLKQCAENLGKTPTGPEFEKFSNI